MATQTLILQNPAALFPCRSRAAAATGLRRLPTTSAFSPNSVSIRLTHAPSLSRRSAVVAVRASSSPPTSPDALNPTSSLLTGSTRTVTTLLAIAIAAAKALAGRILTLALPLKGPIVNSVGPAFFAAIGDDTAGSLNTPFTVVAAGMAKWLDIYSGVLMVRVLLSWFPNIPWDRQPFSAVRDLCDPYLNLFRNIIPPIFDTLDVSPLLAFAVLGTLGSILKSSGAGF